MIREAQPLPLDWVVNSLAMHTDDAVLITKAEPVDMPGPEIVYCNDAFCAMTGYTRDEVLGQTPRLLQGSGTDPEHCRVLREALSAWQPVRQEILNYTKAGLPFWVDLSLRPVADENGWFRYWVGVQRDTTRQRAQKDALERALDAANAANEAKMRFISTLNHELRTPMNGVMGMAALMADDTLSDAQRKRLAIIQESCSKLIEMIGNVLDFARQEQGAVAFDHAPVDVHQLCEGVVDLCRGHVGRKPVVLRLDWDNGAPKRIMGDKVRMRQILLNLVSNGAKFTERGAVTLSVEAMPMGDGVTALLRLIVSDTGLGIEKAKQEQIFEPFTQIDQSETRSHGGTGLGLPLSRSIARRLGGDITVESALGQGARFALELPVTLLPND